jgi:hypothetical protein
MTTQVSQIIATGIPYFTYELNLTGGWIPNPDPISASQFSLPLDSGVRAISINPASDVDACDVKAITQAPNLKSSPTNAAVQIGTVCVGAPLVTGRLGFGQKPDGTTGYITLYASPRLGPYDSSGSTNRYSNAYAFWSVNGGVTAPNYVTWSEDNLFLPPRLLVDVWMSEPTGGLPELLTLRRPLYAFNQNFTDDGLANTIIARIPYYGRRHLSVYVRAQTSFGAPTTFTVRGWNLQGSAAYGVVLYSVALSTTDVLDLSVHDRCFDAIEVTRVTASGDNLMCAIEARD